MEAAMAACGESLRRAWAEADAPEEPSVRCCIWFDATRETVERVKRYVADLPTANRHARTYELPEGRTGAGRSIDR
ncbi:MAG: hypothetical protein Q4B35_06600 [Slackia sp.]|nr:hypothetical protein [Slackia sp.]